MARLRGNGWKKDESWEVSFCLEENRKLNSSIELGGGGGRGGEIKETKGEGKEGEKERKEKKRSVTRKTSDRFPFYQLLSFSPRRGRHEAFQSPLSY